MRSSSRGGFLKHNRFGEVSARTVVKSSELDVSPHYQKAMEVSPNITVLNLAWLGTILFTVGFALALFRRSINGTAAK